MKCPKCGYLGFEEVDRCRNCGYDFSLAASLSIPELPLREDVELRPLDDLALVDQLGSVHDAPSASDLTRDLDVVLGVDAIPASAPPPVAVDPAPPVEPSLFGPPIADDVPLITRARPPRPPLAVRRSTPEVPRLRTDLRTPTLEFAAGEIEADQPVRHAAATPTPAQPAWRAQGQTPSPGATAPALSGIDAGIGARVAAVAIDLGLLAAVDALVVYFTMKICGLTTADLHLLPLAPLIAFLVVQNGGYLVAFTAGGQTLGKMAAGIRVVGDAPGDPVDLGRAVLRELLWLVLAVPAGLGFLSALFSADRRGLHDRFARTRVVRATA
jgi:uncharacterized RDD family membrane protein YckC